MGADLEMNIYIYIYVFLRGKRRIAVAYPHQNANGYKYFKGGWLDILNHRTPVWVLNFAMLPSPSTRSFSANLNLCAIDVIKALPASLARHEPAVEQNFDTLRHTIGIHWNPSQITLGHSTFFCHRLLQIQLNSVDATTDFRTVSPELPLWEFEHLNTLFETTVLDSNDSNVQIHLQPYRQTQLPSSSGVSVQTSQGACSILRACYW